MRYNIEAEIDGEPAQIVKRNIESAAITGGILFVDDLGIKIGENANIANGLTVTLKIKPIPGA
jgi:hypothetical protein